MWSAGAEADYGPPCPCCGGRMIIVDELRTRRRAAGSGIKLTMAFGFAQKRDEAS
jgi:hypothetical protein